MRGGTLYVVATPLGNLGDLSARAAELFRTVPVVAAEDTRRTRNLLTHLGAEPRLLSYHAHSTPGAAAAILRALHAGDDVALVSDAGTPGVSDPGAALVAEVRGAGYGVVPLPGPSAVAAALSAAGLPADRYVFLGFLPRKGTERARLLERVRLEEWTSVLFEAPGRVAGLLGDLLTVCGGPRRAIVARELTKLHEEITAGTLEELTAAFGGEDETRGECTIVVAGASPLEQDVDMQKIRETRNRLLAAGVSKKETVQLLIELLAVKRNDAYEIVNE